MQFTRFSRIALVNAVALVAIAATPNALAEGWRFGWRITTQSSDERVAKAAQPSMAVQMIPGKIRMDFTGERQQPGMKKGGYMLMDAEQGTLAMVSPEDKQALIMEPGSFGGLAGAAGSFVKMDISDIKTAVEDLGAGERLLGRSTHKYRVTRGYTMTVSVFGKKVKTTHQSTTDSWMTAEFVNDRSWQAWAASFARGAQRLGGDGMKKLVDAEKDLPKGVPLKQVVTATDTDDKGKATTTTTTMEMTELKKENLDASLFEVPKDYQIVDMKAQLAETEKAMEQAKSDCEKEHGKGSDKCDPSTMNLDSLVAAARAGAAEGMKEGVKDAAKDAVKKGLFGKLRKP